MRSRSSSGQASVEYVALVAVVAIIFAVAGSFTLQGRAIAAAVMGQLRRGLCIVEGHDCKETHAECTTSSRSSGNELGADIFVVHLGGGSSAIVEHKSNGKVVVTLTDHLDGGAGVGFGAGLQLGEKLSLGAQARASVIASLGNGVGYEVANDRQAEALLRLLKRPKMDPNFLTPADRAYWANIERALPQIPAPVARYRKLELTGSGSADAELGPVSADLSGQLSGGGSENLITHERTYYLKGSVSLDVGGGPTTGRGAEAKAAVTFDRHNKPKELVIVGGGKAETSSSMPVALQSIVGDLKTGSGRSWELEGHLDLTQPGRWDAVRHSVLHPDRLMQMILDDGTVEANTYGTEDSSFKLSGHVKEGLAIGGQFSHHSETTHLLSAMEHTPEGFWVPRYDCLAAA
jgi:hypothetical protein